MRRPLAALVLSSSLWAMAASAPAQGPGLNVKLPPAPGFAIGYQARSGRQVLVELVPTGESVKNFNRMISMQTFPGMGRVRPPVFIAEFTKRYRGGCPRSIVNVVPLGRDGGVRIDCPRHPNTGRTETVIARAIPVGPDMALVHITLKYTPLPREAQWARDYLGRVTIG
jgi:hypothetical protein